MEQFLQIIICKQFGRFFEITYETRTTCINKIASMSWTFNQSSLYHQILTQFILSFINCNNETISLKINGGKKKKASTHSNGIKVDINSSNILFIQIDTFDNCKRLYINKIWCYRRGRNYNIKI